MRTLHIITFLLLAMLVVFMASCGSKEHAFYVSPTGDDTARGNSPDKAFATIARARDAARELTASGKKTKPVVINILAGTYELTEPIVFTPEDSGTAEMPVTIRGFGEGRALVSGGSRITGWTVRDDGAWTVTVSADRQFRQLFVNGERRVRARTPNTGEYFIVKGILTEDDPAVLPFDGTDINPAWAEKGDVELVSLNKWTEFKLPIKAVDIKKKTATLTQKFYNWIRETNARYWVENTPDALDIPGEWYLDFDSGQLTYLPLPGEDPKTAEVIAPRLTELIRFTGDPAAGKYVTDIAIEGIDLAYTDWTMPRFEGYIDGQAANQIPGVIRADGSKRIAIRNCTLSHFGNYAIDFFYACSDCRVEGCTIADVGAGGVRIGEQSDRDTEAEQTFGNMVADNHINHIGEVFPEACGVIIFRSGKNTIAHNDIHDTYYTGISNGWSWGYAETNTRENIIEFNHVYNIGRGMLSDMGGNYNLGVQPGSVIRNNLFHDISSSGYGGWGIYTDEGSTDILIENNVVYNTKTGGFHQHYGRNNTVVNNIFAFSLQNQLIRSRGEEHLSFTMERNIVIWNESDLLGGNWGMTVNIYNTDDSLKKATDTTSRYKLDYNCYWNASGAPVTFMGLTFAEWQAKGQDAHSVIADPMFTDVANHDFSLKEGSPALALGFKPIDLSQVGPRH